MPMYETTVRTPNGEEKKRVFNSKIKWAEWFLVKREEGEIHQGWRESFRKNFKI